MLRDEINACDEPNFPHFAYACGLTLCVLDLSVYHAHSQLSMLFSSSSYMGILYFSLFFLLLYFSTSSYINIYLQSVSAHFTFYAARLQLTKCLSKVSFVPLLSLVVV